MTVLVAYASKHGSTAGIAEAIADALGDHEIKAEAKSVDAVDDLGPYEAVVLGSAVYAGSWMKEAVAFAEGHAEELARKRVWLFSSGPLGDDVKDHEEQPRQLPELRRAIAPKEHRMFYGALDTSVLGFAERMIAKAVKAPAGDFRNWDAIRAWGEQIAEELD
ncbi:MAG TPA: flavodoxin domain-containing protein [Actinomycetota bacterium]|nr:flavodoxin domain-containing protein [Actinomycetota bacterium]